MSKDITKYNTCLFAERVMPRVKDLFSDGEDKWWPKPMAKGQRAAVPAFARRAGHRELASDDRLDTGFARRHREFERAEQRIGLAEQHDAAAGRGGRKLGVDHTTVARRIEQLEGALGCRQRAPGL